MDTFINYIWAFLISLISLFIKCYNKRPLFSKKDEVVFLIESTNISILIITFSIGVLCKIDTSATYTTSFLQQGVSGVIFLITMLLIGIVLLIFFNIVLQNISFFFHKSLNLYWKLFIFSLFPNFISFIFLYNTILFSTKLPFTFVIYSSIFTFLVNFLISWLIVAIKDKRDEETYYNILIIDDEIPSISLYFREFLHFFKTLVLPNVIIGISKGSTKNVKKYLSIGFDLVILDFQLSTIDGFERIIKLIMNDFSGTKIYIYTNHKDAALESDIVKKYDIPVFQKVNEAESVMNAIFDY